MKRKAQVSAHATSTPAHSPSESSRCFSNWPKAVLTSRSHTTSPCRSAPFAPTFTTSTASSAWPTAPKRCSPPTSAAGSPLWPALRRKGAKRPTQAGFRCLRSSRAMGVGRGSKQPSRDAATDGRGIAGPACKEGFCCGYVEGLGKEEALSAVTVLALEQGQLLLLLDPLGERLDREGLAELHEGVDECLALRVLFEPGDE